MSLKDKSWTVNVPFERDLNEARLVVDVKDVDLAVKELKHRMEFFLLKRKSRNMSVYEAHKLIDEVFG